MEAAFLLHLYQPPTQDEEVFRQITSECYIPLIKLIKEKKNASFTLNIPLSTMEQMDRYGYEGWINDVKELVETEQVELTGCAAYHPLLTKIPTDLVYKQIILNEYGLGYYFGAHQGFEGEPSILIRDLLGFFPPELAINMDVLKVVDDLGYEWVIADKPAVKEYFDATNDRSGLFTINTINPILIVRDTNFSNLLSFKRDSDIDNVISYINKYFYDNNPNVFVLDAEVFGHHNKDGIYLLEQIIDNLEEKEIKIMTISNIIKEKNTQNIVEIRESTWGESIDEESLVYPYWHDEKIEIHNILWNLQEEIIKHYMKKTYKKDYEGLENIPFWKKETLNEIKEKKLRKEIESEVLVNKSLQSDQFWWASNKKVFDKVLFSPKMVKKALDLYGQIADDLEDKSLIEKVAKSAQKVRNLLKE